MNTIHTNHSFQLHARISGYASRILDNQRIVLGSSDNPASQAQVIELALGLLELSSAGEKINRARTMLWISLQREIANINITDLAIQMARHKNKRGRRSTKAPSVLATLNTKTPVIQ
jgi:hypothetical protein